MKGISRLCNNKTFTATPIIDTPRVTSVPWSAKYTPDDGLDLNSSAAYLARQGKARTLFECISGFGRRTVNGKELFVLEKRAVLDLESGDQSTESLRFSEKLSQRQVVNLNAEKGTLKDWVQAWKVCYGSTNLEALICLLSGWIMNLKKEKDTQSHRLWKICLNFASAKEPKEPKEPMSVTHPLIILQISDQFDRASEQKLKNGSISAPGSKSAPI